MNTKIVSKETFLNSMSTIRHNILSSHQRILFFFEHLLYESFTVFIFTVIQGPVLLCKFQISHISINYE